MREHVLASRFWKMREHVSKRNDIVDIVLGKSRGPKLSRDFANLNPSFSFVRSDASMGIRRKYEKTAYQIHTIIENVS
jgi:hypothetical protein